MLKSWSRRDWRSSESATSETKPSGAPSGPKVVDANMRWIVLAAAILISVGVLYFGLFNTWLTGTPGGQGHEQAQRAGLLIIASVVVFLLGIGTFAWMSVRQIDRRHRKAQDDPKSNAMW